MTARLALIATEIETAASETSLANPTDAGYWLRIALAAESIAGFTTSANDTLLGYMYRAALAFDYIGGIDGSIYNHSEEGYLARTAAGVEAYTGITHTGSHEYRLHLALIDFDGPVTGDGTLDFSSADDSGLLALLMEDE